MKLLLPDDPEELALNLNGKKRRLTAEDFAAFAQTLHLTQVQYSRALARLTRALAETLDTTLNRSFLSERFQSSFQSLLTERMKTFGT